MRYEINNANTLKVKADRLEQRILEVRDDPEELALCHVGVDLTAADADALDSGVGMVLQELVRRGFLQEFKGPKRSRRRAT